jgi:hypothetical protein
MTAIDNLDKDARARFQARLFSHVDTSAGLWGCWEWQAGGTKDGYGTIKIGGKMCRTHRAVYELYHGPIPDGLCICHTCDNRRCCNPAHLWVGTIAENSADRDEKGRHSPARGEQVHGVKLHAADVQEIRALLAAGVPQTVIAARYGVSTPLIWHIKMGRAWAWLPDDTLPETMEAAA